MKEIGYAREKRVWVKIKRSEAIKKGWRIQKTTWIEINKGDADNVIMRSRFVAK